MSYNNQNLHTESVSAVTATPSVELGVRRIVDGREYVYAYNACNSEATQFALVQRAAGASSTSFTVSTTTDPYVMPMGVVHNATFPTGTYGWLLVKGHTYGIYAGTVTAPVAMALYPNLIPGANGTITPATGGTGTTGAAVVCGRAMSAVSDITGGTFAIYIDCRC